MIAGAPQPATINSDGTFVIDNVLAGEYRLSSLFGPSQAAGLYLKEARFGTADLLTQSVMISPAVSGDLQVVLGSDAGAIAGSVRDTQGGLVPRAEVVLVPAITARQDLFKMSLTDANGHFTMSGIAPGSYTAVAVDPQLLDNFFDPAVMRKYQSNGVPVTVGSATLNLDLRVISGK